MLRVFRCVRPGNLLVFAARTQLQQSICRVRYLSNNAPLFSTEDEKLINRGDFFGVKAVNVKTRSSPPPEVVLSSIQDSLRRNFRVNGEVLLADVVLRLENGDKVFSDVLRRSADRWFPLLITCCGAPLSNVHKASRMVLLDRICQQFEELGVPLTTASLNRKLAVMLQNDHTFDVQDVLKLAEENHNSVELNQMSFSYLLEQLARGGDVDSSRNMVYEMARRGLIVDAQCNASLVYCFAVRGHLQKADSLVQQTSVKFGDSAVPIAMAACARAAAARADTDRLRYVLRHAVDDKKKLIFDAEGVFETIWQLAEKSRDGDGAEFVNLTEQILDHSSHHSGFFRYLFREIERHIAHEHYYTAVALLEDTNRVKDCLRNQQRTLFMEQMLSRLCRQLIRSEVPVGKVNDVANRITAIFRRSAAAASYRIYDELLFASLMYKPLSLDQRFEYLSSFVDYVDRDRTRPHLMLPILASTDDTDERLKAMFRCSAIGYKDMSKLDTRVLAKMVLQPLYDRQRPGKRMGEQLSRLDQTFRVLKSYGSTEQSIFETLREWWRVKIIEERNLPEEAHLRPTSKELQGFLREKYVRIFTDRSISTKSGIPPTYDRLKYFVESGDSAKVHTFLTSYGWPEETNFEEIVPRVLDMYLEHEEWAKAKKMLIALSGQSNRWVRADGTTFTAIKNFHLLKILRRRANESEDLSMRNLIDFCYELRRMFPNATAQYETFFDSLYEYNRLFSRFFEVFSPLTVEKVDEIIEFLRTIIKLDIISLHPNETLTTVIVNSVLRKLGWSEAVNTWMKFQSGLYCSNALVALLRHCFINQKGNDSAMSNVQYVLHKAQNFSTASRVHSLYLAVLVSLKKHDEAEKYCDAHKDSIVPWDLVIAMRLMNALKFRNTDEEFVYKFAKLCLEKSNLMSDNDAIQAMQQDWMRLYEVKKLGPLALRFYELFRSHGLNLPGEEKKRLVTMVEEHDRLARRWMYAPSGFLKITEDDPIITGSEAWQIQQNLRREVQELG